jgi:hypothetical protein
MNDSEFLDDEVQEEQEVQHFVGRQVEAPDPDIRPSCERNRPQWAKYNTHVKPVRCQYCGILFSGQSSLSTHVFFDHPEPKRKKMRKGACEHAA